MSPLRFARRPTDGLTSRERLAEQNRSARVSYSRARTDHRFHRRFRRPAWVHRFLHPSLPLRDESAAWFSIATHLEPDILIVDQVLAVGPGLPMQMRQERLGLPVA